MARLRRAAATVLLLVLSDPRAAYAQNQDAAAAEARVHYDRGMQLYKDGEARIALVELERAYDLSPSFRILYNIGQVDMQLQSYAAARRAFERYLADGGDKIPEPRRKEVEAELGRLRSRTAHVALKTNVDGAEVSVDGVPRATTPVAVPILLDPGQHTFVVAIEGRAPVSRVVTLAGGDAVDLEMLLEPAAAAHAPEEPAGAVEAPAPAPSPPVRRDVAPAPVRRDASRSYVWLGWTATAALAAAATATGVATLVSLHALDDERGTPARAGQTAADKQRAIGDAESTAHGLAITADVLGIAAITAGALSLFFTLRAPRGRAHSASAVQVGIAPGAVELTKRF